MADLLFRGRGADIGARAPVWLVRLAGAALGFALAALAGELGIWTVLGFESWWLQLAMMIAGAMLAPSRAGSLLWFVTGALVLVSCLVSYTPIVQTFVPPFIRRDAESRVPVDAVAVLSGGMTADGLVSGAALDRLLTGLGAAKARRIPSVMLSVIDNEGRGARVTSEADQRALATLIVPEVDVRFVHDVHSTHDEALAFAALARTHGWQRVLVVTSPSHTRRACASIEATGLMVQCLPSNPRDYSVRRLDGTHARRLAFADVMYETAATLLYRSRGWTKR